MRSTPTLTLALALVGLFGAGAAVAGPPRAAPSSTEGAYVLPLTRGVGTTALLTVGDAAANGYRLVGNPDGLGAFDNGDGTFTLLVNHELRTSEGIVRAHGRAGSFVSRWTIDSETRAVLVGEDLVRRQFVPAATGGWTAQAITLGGLCSADLPEQGAFHDPASGTGTPRRLLLNGEENGNGRAFATVVDGPDAGSSYLLAGLGRASWENQVTMPDTGRQTVVVGTDDSPRGEIYVYVGEKSGEGNDVERAGLTGGRLFGVRIEGVAEETDATVLPARGAAFSLVEIPGAAAMSTAVLQSTSLALGVSQLARAEDSAWDPSQAGRLYATTTGTQLTTSRLWSLDFNDPADVTAGGVARVEVSSPAFPGGPRSMDNLTVNQRGQVLVQEDRGPQPALSGIYQYDPRTGGLLRIAEHDPARFTTDSPGDPDPRFLTQDEESSGIIRAPFLGAGQYLLTSMAHHPTGDPETVEGGQLLLMHVPPGKPVR